MLLDADPVNAFLPYEAIEVPHASDGPLAGLTFGLKDLFDLQGYRTGCGCPTKLAISPVATRSAPAAQALLDAGARCVGKTHTDELAWALYGMNVHFGTPINPAAPDRIPGGSSSGSAAAVAAGLVDFAVGTDTGGSVRAPSSFCGLWGLRPTHGRVSLDGCMELAGSFDTGGAFARDSETLAKVMAVLAGEDTAPLPEAPRFLIPTDMVDRLAGEQRAVYDEGVASIEAEPVEIYPEGGAERLYDMSKVVIGRDTASTILPFVDRTKMPLAAGIDERVAAARTLTSKQIAEAEAERRAFTDWIDRLLGSDGVLFAPAVHDAPFKRDAGRDVFDTFRHDAMKLLCVAGMSGLPQVVFPAGRVDGAPYGLSLIGPRGSDLSLIALAASVTRRGRP